MAPSNGAGVSSLALASPRKITSTSKEKRRKKEGKKKEKASLI